MLSILIVEDEPLFAETLEHLVELNPPCSVIALADDRNERTVTLINSTSNSLNRNNGN